MYRRTIYDALEAHLNNKLITVITGMRRVGKTTAMQHLFQRVSHTNKVFLELEKIENRYIFTQPTYNDVKIELEILGIDFNEPALIALDEIQLVPEITSIIKYFYDHFNIKFLLTGSSSFYIKGRFSESLAGRKRIFEMFPLSFLEFLQFKEVDKIDILQKFALQPFRQGIYQEFKTYYQEYIRYGGFPEVVLGIDKVDKIAYLKYVINAYIELDIKLLSDFEASNTLYRLICLLASRIGSKVDYTKISGILGISRQKVKSYIQLLEKTYFIQLLSPYTHNTDNEIKRQQKIYFTDTGLANQLARLNDGQLFENALAAQLRLLGELHFYQRKNGQEIDFILNRDTAIEVKETPTEHDLTLLKQRAYSIDMQKTMLIGKHPPASDFKDFIWGGTIF